MSSTEREQVVDLIQALAQAVRAASQPALLEMDEAAAYLKVHPKTLNRWVAGGLVPFTTLAGSDGSGDGGRRMVRFAPHHLAAIVAMGEQLPLAPPPPGSSQPWIHGPGAPVTAVRGPVDPDAPPRRRGRPTRAAASTGVSIGSRS